MKKIYFSLAMLMAITFNFSQTIRCYSDEMELELRNQHPELPSREEFDQWLDQEISNKSGARIIGGVYQIPVVVHVIHSGEAVGSGTNISYAAIKSQIDVLNEDFRKLFGSNGYNTNAVGADTEIEFCLAKRRPDGSAFPNGEDGVNRILYSTITSTTPPYTTSFINSTIKPYTYNNGTATATRGWHPGKYLNIWVCNISGGILGYAQFPQSPLGGMGCGSTVDATDGVVFIYNSIGKSSVTGFSGAYAEGRTATHEIGHWLGLRHIWGDGNCTATDYCNDTPPAAQANFGCPTGLNSCTTAPDAGPDMIENYMDYTDDLCMNIFTKDQKTRMRTVLESSPLRVSLINSDACVPPNVSDVSVVDILNPKGDNCPGSVSPIVTIKNRGSSNLTSAVINYKIGTGSVVTFNYAGNLAPSATANVTLPSSTTYLGTHRITAYTTLPNGVTDPAPELDTIELDFVVSNGLNAPYSQDFEGDVFPPDIKWVSENTGNDCYEWVGASATSISNVVNNNTAQFPGFGNSSSNTDNLITPIFILPCNASAADIKFDVAYRRVSTTTTNYDTLFVEISENCGSTWNAIPIYKKGGTQLQQNTTTLGSYYTPSLSTDWRTETIDLTSYITTSSKNVKFRFRARGRNGNNIYVDNFKFNVTAAAEINIAQNGVEVLDEGAYNFGNVTIGTSSQKTFTVSNTGSSDLTLTLPVTISGSVFTLANNNLMATITAGTSKTFDIVFTPTAQTSYTETLTLVSNDCDETTYNFYLFGTGTVNMPVANFSANVTSVCTGTTITFTNSSTYSSSYAWDFGPNAIPTTSSATNPVVQFTTAGQHTVTLVATNPYGSDSEVKTNYITAISSTGGQAIPFTEGFTTATFPPTGWTRVNANASATTWARSTTVGRIPTTGNSMFFNNFSFNDGDDDQMKMPGMDLSSVTTAELVFDIAYAPYSGTIFDGLEVLVSTDCGLTFTSVYSKSGTTLATASATTTSFVPTAAQWRTETINLSAYVGNANLIISFKNLSGNGQNLYVDNINVREGAKPVSDFSASATTVCAGSSITYTDLSTNSPTSWSWTFPGGTPATSTAQNPTVTYSTAGTYNVILTASNTYGAGTTMTKVNHVTINPAAIAATCNPTSGGTTYGITNVTLNTINNTTPLNDGAIMDYSCTKTTSLTTNTLYNISTTVGTAGAHWLRVYIDYNNDGDFVDAGETVFAPTNGTGTLTGSFTTPASVGNYNTLLRMRVITDRSTGGTATTPGSCTALSRGQGEDYGVIILPPCTNPTITASSGSTRCGTGTVTFSATPSAGTINWYDASAGGNLVGTGTIFSPSLSSTTTYYAEAVNSSCVSATRTAVSSTINSIPSVDNLSNTSSCGSYVLPTLTNGNYYSASGATGSTFVAGNSITNSQLLYIYATNGTCTNESSFTVTIDITPIPDAPLDRLANRSYTLPPLIVGNYFTGTGGTGTALYAGNVLTSNQRIYVYASGGSCPSAENSFYLTILTTLLSADCGKSLTSVHDILHTNPITGAVNYRYEVSDGTNTYYYTKGSSVSTFSLYEVSNQVKCGLSYSIKVSYTLDGTTWTPYGRACSVTVPLTRIRIWYCGGTLNSISSWMGIYEVANAVNYRYQLFDGTNTLTYTKGSSDVGLNLSLVSGIQFNKLYTIKVAHTIDGVNWSAYGPSCSITTPMLTEIKSWYCDNTLTSMSSWIGIYGVSNAVNYRYQLYDGTNTLVYTRGSADVGFRMSWVSGIQYNKTYTVKVAYTTNGTTWSAYGNVCTITTPVSGMILSDQDNNYEDINTIEDLVLETYPNPNDGNFTISSSHEGTFNIINELGQLIQKVDITKENNYQTKVENLRQGVYFVTCTINNEVITKKVVVQ